MTISLDLILESLSIALPKVIFRRSSPQTFSGVSLFSRQAPPDDPSVLYFHTLSDIAALPNGALSALTFVAFGEEAKLCALPEEAACNVLLYTERDDFVAVYNHFCALFARFQAWENAMDRVLLANGSLQELMDVGSTFFENPIFIWDPAFRIQAYHKTARLPHPFLREVVEQGCISGHFLDAILSLKYFHNADRYRKLTIVYPPTYLNYRLALRVFNVGHRGVLTMGCYFSNKPLTQGHQELLELFSDAVARYAMQHFEYAPFRNHIYEHLLVGLVEGTLSKDADILDQLHILRLPFRSRFRVHVIRFDQRTDALVSYMIQSAKTQFPYSKIIPYRRGALVLEHMRDADPDTRMKQEQDFTAFCAEVSARTGISTPFFCLNEVREGYLQAVACLDLGSLLSPQTRLYHYREYYLYHLLGTYMEAQGIRAGHIIPEGLRRIAERDAETGSNDIKLLEYYLDNDRGIKQTAIQMHLHRNSVVYRLARIEAMLDASLTDSDVRLRLMISFRLKRLLEARERAAIAAPDGADRGDAGGK